MSDEPRTNEVAATVYLLRARAAREEARKRRDARAARVFAAERILETYARYRDLLRTPNRELVTELLLDVSEAETPIPRGRQLR